MNWLGKRKPPPIRSLVSEGTVVTGDIRFAEGLRIDGEVHGNISAATDSHSILVISEKARVHGKVTAGHVIINGEVRGPVHSDDMLELQPKARIVGDIRYELLEMHQGAQVDGELKSLKNAEKPALKLAASNEVKLAASNEV
jgi:cytoskeletal protein CcmA (bactofilin family)